MGGSAFSSKFNQSAFPRLPPVVYEALKARLLPNLQYLYSFVAVPAEAPEKGDYGDLDFVVAGPKHNEMVPANTLVNVPHERVQAAIDAQYVNPMEGNRTSNFAVPVSQGEWGLLGHAQEENNCRQAAEAGVIFYQVDVHVCADQAEWERVVFFHAYGDLGMILGLISRNAGLALGIKGLKLPNAPHPPVELSETFDEIVAFMGLSIATWKAGFKSKREVFEWAGTSKFFVPSQFKTEGDGISKVKAERKMYAEFVVWAQERAAAQGTTGRAKLSKEEREERQFKIRDEALVYFGKKEAFDTLTREYSQRIRLKQVFSGSKVRDWAGIGEYWVGVKMIMDAVRLQVGGEDGVLKILDEEGEEGIRKIVLVTRDELGIIPNTKPTM